MNLPTSRPLGPQHGFDPAAAAEAVTPSDTASLSGTCCRLYVGGTGDVSLVDSYGNTVKYQSVPAGAYLSIRAKRVLSTGTTATKIVAEY